MPTITGRLQKFGVTTDERKKRRYIVAHLTFKEAREIFERKLFSGQSGQGYQRAIIEAHARKLKNAIRDAEFTPTALAAKLKTSQTKELLEKGNGYVSLEVDGQTVPLIDGGHRLEGMELLRAELEAKEEAELLKELDNLPIEVIIHIDGDERKDFIRLQEGKAVSRTQQLSMKRYAKELSDEQNQAYDLLKAMNQERRGEENCFLSKQISFDTRTTNTRLHVDNLMTTNSSDIASSVVAGIRIINHYERDVDFLVKCYNEVWYGIQERLPDLAEEGRLFHPIWDGGQKVGILLTIAFGNLLAYRCCVLEKDQPDSEEMELVIESVRAHFDLPAKTSMGFDVKRPKLREYAIDYFADLIDKDAENPLPSHRNLPIELLEKFIAPSSFGVDSLPKKKKGV